MLSPALQKNYRLAGLLTFLFFLLCLLPIVYFSVFAKPVSAEWQAFFRPALAAGALAVVALMYRIPLPVSATQKRVLFFLFCGLAAMLVDLHFSFVEFGANYFNNADNLDYQMQMHNHVLQLDPRLVPHSYRFLPNGLVRLLEFLSGRYLFATALYRGLFMFLLLYGLYYFARLYTHHSAAVLTVLFYAALYPVTIRYYTGQPTDPLSHLLFLLAFICMETGLMFPFVLCVAVGVFVKESIVVLPVYLLLTRRDPRTTAKMILLLIFCAAAFLWIRAFVLEGVPLTYHAATNLTSAHILNNLRTFPQWGKQNLFTLGIVLPLLAGMRRTADPRLMRLSLYLVFLLGLINLLFSWLAETRNLVPALIPILVILSAGLTRSSADPKPGP